MRLTTECFHNISEAVVRGDYITPRRKRGVRIGVEREKLLRRQRAEAQEPQPPQLLVEAARADVEVLLFDLRVVLDPVVIKDDVRAAGDPFPLSFRRDGTNAQPESDVRREAQKRAGRPDERFDEPELAGCPPDDTSPPVRVEKGAQL